MPGSVFFFITQSLDIFSIQSTNVDTKIQSNLDLQTAEISIVYLYTIPYNLNFFFVSDNWSWENSRPRVDIGSWHFSAKCPSLTSGWGIWRKKVQKCFFACSIPWFASRSTNWWHFQSLVIHARICRPQVGTSTTLMGHSETILKMSPLWPPKFP